MQGGGGVVDTAAAVAPMVRRTICCKPRGKGTHSVQGRCVCKDCQKHSIYICSVCMHTTNPNQKQFWFCNPMLVEGSKCFTKHIAEAHVPEAHKDD